jgi:hypothetical protein
VRKRNADNHYAIPGCTTARRGRHSEPLAAKVVEEFAQRAIERDQARPR